MFEAGRQLAFADIKLGQTVFKGEIRGGTLQNHGADILGNFKREFGRGEIFSGDDGDAGRGKLVFAERQKKHCVPGGGSGGRGGEIFAFS